MPNPASVSKFYREKLEKHQLNPQELAAVRYAFIKHTLIASATTVTLGTSAYYFVGNLVGLSIGMMIAVESGMKSVEGQLQGTGSELLYLMDRYSKATLREKMGQKGLDELMHHDEDESNPSLAAPRMINRPVAENTGDESS
ncbi:hypothetical protein BGW38_003203 [Lunasporangiospora selenospora]|uniref:Uncharacterized protein n=1 Tax=Lunasporangiospora selenospora TaxID=979761 RepID=A0A9P6G3Q8_9FUNG|nr:hypothetical protein BGW38_003203 [Lunasporangiospora selenospora]